MFGIWFKMPVLVLTSYNEKITPTQAINFYKKLECQFDCWSSVSNDDGGGHFIKNMANAVPHVFLYVSELRKNMSSDDDLRYLTDDEFNEMYEKLKPYLQEKEKQKF